VVGGGEEGSVALTCRVKWGPGGEKRQKRLSGFFVYPRRGEEGGGPALEAPRDERGGGGGVQLGDQGAASGWQRLGRNGRGR
jgi:hypothetical protein